MTAGEERLAFGFHLQHNVLAIRNLYIFREIRQLVTYLDKIFEQGKQDEI